MGVEWVTKSVQKEVKERKSSKLWKNLFYGNREGTNRLLLEKINTEEKEIQITKEDIAPELEYWKYSLFAYILSQDLPVSVMVNFWKARWKGIEMPRVVKHKKGYFVLRFEKKEDMDAALERGNQFFYSKQLILRKWKEGEELGAEITNVPVWVQLPNLPLEMWGGINLSKIANRIGKPMYTDEMTARKLKLEYARMLVQVEVGKELPKTVNIRSKGKMITQEIKYEWLPVKCNRCHVWAHTEGNCKKLLVQRWQVQPTGGENGKGKEILASDIRLENREQI